MTTPNFIPEYRRHIDEEIRALQQTKEPKIIPPKQVVEEPVIVQEPIIEPIIEPVVEEEIKPKILTGPEGLAHALELLEQSRYTLGNDN
jgi:hypothetical protein